MTELPKKQWVIDIPKKGIGHACMAAGLLAALDEAVKALGKAAPEELEPAWTAAIQAIKTFETERIPMEDEAAGFRSARNAVDALFERVAWDRANRKN